MANPSASSPPSPPASRALRWLRLSLIVAPLAVALISAAGYSRWHDNQRRLAKILETTGVAARDEGAERQLGWERGSDYATLTAARALVYDFLAAQEASPAGAAARLEQLAQGRALAREALAAQPSSWQGWLLEGAATYLERSQRQDRRLYTEAAAWELPLRRAHELAPGKNEPKRFLTAAYLEVWPALSREKKAFAQELVREIFAREPRTFTRLLPAWLAVARGTEVFAPIPDRTEAWHQVLTQLAHRQDWRRLIEARERYLAAIEREMKERVAEGGRALDASDDRREARTILLSTIALAPAEMRFVPHVAAALDGFPPGVHNVGDAAPLRRWIEWALALDTLGKSPLDRVMLERLAAAIGDPLPVVEVSAQWQQHRYGWRVILQPEAAARELEVEIAAAPTEGAVVAWQWDGAEVEVTMVKPGRQVDLDLEITRGPHLLELVTVAGGMVTPGAVRLNRPR